MLYKLIALPSEEPVQYVGVYVLKWGKTDEPTVAFREATQEEMFGGRSHLIDWDKLWIEFDGVWDNLVKRGMSNTWENKQKLIKIFVEKRMIEDKDPTDIIENDD